MESLNRIGRALLVVSALGLPAFASAEAPPAKPGAAAKKDAAPKAKKAHKGAKADDKAGETK
jgi:hypothetical protein